MNTGGYHHSRDQEQVKSNSSKIVSQTSHRIRNEKSLRRNGDERQFFISAGISQCEEKHHRGQRPLGSPVAVIDPKPMAPILY